MANIVGLSSLRNSRGNAPGGGNGSGSDGDDDAARNQYYAGGASDRGGGSGLSVIGPDGGGDPMANIIGRAQRDTADAPPAGSSSGAPRHTITFYREGFTVNDGPYRARADPANRPFLDALERGYVAEDSPWNAYKS